MRDFFVNCCIWLVAAAIIISVVVLVGGFAFTRHASITAEDASLTRFALVTTSLTYNLSLTLSVRNPNWVMSWKYTEPLVAFYGFNGQSFDRIRLEDDGKKLAARKTQVYHLSTEAANEYVPLGGDGIAQFKRQNVTGEFEVEVVLTSEILCKLHYTRCMLKATCTLKLQLAPPEGRGGTPCPTGRAS
jgi:hypothetical protein